MKLKEIPFGEHKLDLHWYSLYEVDPLLEKKEENTPNE